MAIDVNTLSQKELASLINQAKKRQTTLKKRKSATTVRARLTALARAEGYTVAELFGGSAASTPRTSTRAAPAKAARKGRKLGKVEPKYRNPANAAETWTGRGKQPRWLAEMVRNGRTVDEFLIGS